MFPVLFIIAPWIISASALKCNKLLTAQQPGEILENGELLSANETYKQGFFKTINDTHYSVCMCSVKSCLRKCCARNEIFDRMRCVPGETNRDFNPAVHEASNPDQVLPRNYSEKLYFLPGVTCANVLTITNYVNVQWNETMLLSNGSLLLPNKSTAHHLVFPPDNYCLESFMYHNGKVYGPTAYLCYPRATASNHRIVHMVGYMLSIVSLIVTFAVYAVLPELQNLHGKSLMCHILAYTGSLISLVASHLGPPNRNFYDCFVIGTIIAMTTLAAFFWLSVMGFDIWWTFSEYGYYKKSVLGSEKKSFVLYSVYAWCMPVLLMLITYGLDHIPEKYFPSFLVRPKFGIGRCWYTGRSSKLLYFFGPIGILLLCNILFFSITMYNLIRAKKQTSGLRRRRGGTAKNNTANRQQFGLYLKLFLVMGLSWTLEVIGQFTDQKYLNFINTYQGFFIFLIFVCKKRIKERLMAKYGSKLIKRTHHVKNWQKNAAKHIATRDLILSSGTWKPKPDVVI